MNKKHKNRIPIISFFSGGGFMDMGFMKAGFDIVFANEFCKYFVDIHDEGVKSWCDVNAIKFKKITSTASITKLKPGFILKSAFKGNIPQLWGIIGGPPCQDFTMQGNGIGFNGERGKMTAVFYNRIRKMKPAFFVMENVPGLLARKEQKEILDDLIRKYISEDYYVDRTILNALDYGVPQYRRRVFIVGLKKDLFHPNPRITNNNEDIRSMVFPWPAPLYENARDNFNWPTQNPFGKDIEKPFDIPEELCVQRCLKSTKDANVPNIDEYPFFRVNAEKRKLINEGDTSGRSFKRLHRYKYSPTECFGNNEIYLHPYENRRLSVREALRIQGVDDSYALSLGNMTAKYKVISNGVPVPLAYAVATSLYNIITDL